MPTLRFVTAFLAAFLAAVLAMPSLAQETQTSRLRYQYDNNGNRILATDALGRTTRTAFDALNRPQRITDAANGISQYFYDGQDHLLQAIDPRGGSTRYTIDGWGQLRQRASPDSGTASFSFDGAGNEVGALDANGQSTARSFDLLGRLTELRYADGMRVTYTWDQGENALGHLSRIDDGISAIAYRYDRRGRVLEETRSIEGRQSSTGYEYTASGRLAALRYPDGRRILYEYDGLGRVVRIACEFEGRVQALVQQVDYAAFGQVQNIVLANGQQLNRGYDLDGRVSFYTLANQSRAVAYDGGGRLSALADPADGANGRSFGYDALDRVTAVQQPGLSLSYAWDANGNRSGTTAGAAATTYAYASNGNRLASMRGSRTNAILLDANGSILDDGNARYAYDARGRLRQANTAGVMVTYTVNALGQRVAKRDGDALTIFHYDLAGRLIAEEGSGGSSDYVYLGDMPVAILRQGGGEGGQ